MTTFCSNMTCQQRQECRKSLFLSDMQKVYPYPSTVSFCIGFEPLEVKSKTWLEQMSSWLEWKFL